MRDLKLSFPRRKIKPAAQSHSTTLVKPPINIMALVMKNKSKSKSSNKLHFVLVHGAGHGAWCWYKLTPLLQSQGHDVTAMDLAGDGINPKQIRDVVSVQDYVEPLMEVMGEIPEGEKVVLVGHSMGGLAQALAMEAFPEKISLAVFLAASVYKPNTTLFPDSDDEPPPTKKYAIDGDLWDTKFSYDDGPDNPPTSVIFGPQMLSHRLYQQSSPEDLSLVITLLRETRIFVKAKSKNVKFTSARYGSMPRVFAICEEDKLANKETQRAMIESAEVDEVEVIEGADHMAMISRPQELCTYLLKVAHKYSS